jgi:hypothetical protein
VLRFLRSAKETSRARCVTASSRGLAQQPLDEHAFLPLAIEATPAALHADLLEAGGAVRREALPLSAKTRLVSL